MVDTYTTGKLGLIEPARGGYVDTWYLPLYANWQTLDAAVSGTTSITLSNANVVLTVPTYPGNANPPAVSTSCQNLRLYLTGSLAANLTIFIPATVGGFWIVDDRTTSNGYTVTVKTTAVGSTGITTVNARTLIMCSDGTNVFLADSGNVTDLSLLVRPGSIVAFGGTSAPSGYLLCTGSAVSRTTYSALFSAIGTSWGSGDGSTTFNVPDLTNMFLRGSGSSAVGVYESDDFKSHTHAVTDPGHLHSISLYDSDHTSGAGDWSHQTGPSYSANTNTATTGISVGSTGGSETRPVNKRVLYIIKT